MKWINSLKDTNYQISLAPNMYFANQWLEELVGAVAYLYRVTEQQPKSLGEVMNTPGTHQHLPEEQEAD